MTFYDPKIHHRRSVRLQGYDYAHEGAYFVTVCSRDHKPLFGRVMEGQMQMNRLGRLVATDWLWLSHQYSYAELDEYVVMPNHLHGIVVINDRDRGGSRTAPTVQKRKPLGRLIGAFKTVSTKHMNSVRGTPGGTLWQRNYHERIIRDEEELNRIREYIQINPAQWAFDRENPDRQGPAVPEPFS